MKQVHVSHVYCLSSVSRFFFSQIMAKMISWSQGAFLLSSHPLVLCGTLPPGLLFSLLSSNRGFKDFIREEWGGKEQNRE